MFFATLIGLVAVCLIIRQFLRLLRIRNYGDRYVFITGCDSGFGNLLAKRLDKKGVNVFTGCLTERGADDLMKGASARLKTIHIDVADETSILKAKADVMKKLPANRGLWAIVNNAGVPGPLAPIEWITPDDFKKTLGINLFGVIFVTQAFLPLVRQERGRVINMGSIMGRYTLSTGPYGTSKFALEGYSDQLRRELYHTSVSVHLIQPGFFHTGFVDYDKPLHDLQSRFDAADDEIQRYYGNEYIKKKADVTVAAWRTLMSPYPEKVARAYQHAILAKYPKIRYVVGWDANLLFRFMWYLPEWLGDYLATMTSPVPAGATVNRQQ